MKKKIPIAFFVTLFIVLGGMGLAARFIVGGFFNERATYASLRTQINDIQYKRNQLVLAQASAQNVDSDVSRIQKAFVGQSDILNALVPLEQEAVSAGVIEYKVTVAQDITSEGQASAGANSSLVLQGTTLRIEGKGTLEGLFAFVRTLQSLPYFLRIESLQIQQADSSGGSGAAPLEIVIIVKFYNSP